MGNLPNRVLLPASSSELAQQVLLSGIELGRRRDGNMNMQIPAAICPQMTDALAAQCARTPRLSA